jgi:PAS domain S-box-containing protein
MGKVHRQSRALVALAILLACRSCAFALDPSLDINQYAHTAWKIRDGFSKGRITSFAQTPDGYLWLGTEFGLLRFDGVRNVPWDRPGGERLPSSYVRSLLAARDGRLWIGTYKGLASWKDGKLTEYRELAGQTVDVLLQDREGTVWAGGYAGSIGRLCAIQSGSAQCYGDDGRLGLWVASLYEDSRGNLWAGAQTGLWRWKPGPPKLYPMPYPLIGTSSQTMNESDDGALLIAAQGGIKKLVDGKAEAYSLPGTGPRRFNPLRMFRDRNGSLWIGTTDGGLLHVHQGRTDVFTQSDGLSGDYINKFFEDREGTVWVATVNGLDRFRDFAVPTISVRQGLSTAVVWSVLGARDGGVWLGTPDGLNRWNNGQITIYRKRAAPGGSGGGKQEREPNVREVADGGLPDDGVESLFQDDGGRIWAFTERGAAYFENGRFIPVTTNHAHAEHGDPNQRDGQRDATAAVALVAPSGQLHSITGDSSGNLWISDQHQGLFHLLGKSVVERIPWATLGRKDWAMALLAGPVPGGLWLGFSRGGVAYFKDGKVGESYSGVDGLGEGIVTSLSLDSDGTLWAATEGGLSRIKNGRVATLTSQNGLPCDTVFWVMQDDAHAFWLYTACGLVRIAGTEMAAWVTDPKRTIQNTVFDSSDGVRNRALTTGYTPLVAKTVDGKLWFLPLDGVSVIDPRHLPFNQLPPPVHIEQVAADRKTYWQNWSGDASSSRLRLPPLVRDLTIDYTALSLVVPEKVHFRFKLEGQDQDWREVVNDREVQYSNLAPGNYCFRVTASNNSGVWNQTGAFLNFSIAPAFYQTNWFRVLCPAAFVALLWLLYQVRIRQVRRQERKLRDVIETIPTFAWTSLPDGSVYFVNRHWQQYTGLSTETTPGSGWRDATVHPEDLERHAEKWRASLATGEPFDNEVRYRRADGQYRWFLTRAVPQRDARGKILSWYGISTDIEDRKRAEQERERLRADLAHVNRVSMLGELAASVSHELKQPIAAAMTNAKTCMRWLQREQPDTDEALEAASRIVKDGRRATEIIDRMRSLYKKSPTQRELVDLNEIVRDMLLLLRGEAYRYSISMRAELAPDLPTITADRVQLQQVLMNLMLNAIEAMKDTAGDLTVKTELGEAGQLLISVSDTGVGLPNENTEQIFDAFFTTKPQGSGMGLSISRSIVESHGGRLWADDNPPRGARFCFTLLINGETRDQVVSEDRDETADGLHANNPAV